MASELFLVNPRGRRVRRRIRRGRRNPAGELLVLTGNPRGRRRQRSGSSHSKAARALRLAKRLRSRGLSAKRALKAAWGKILHKRAKRVHSKRTHHRSKSHRIHSRRKSASSRRTHMARRKRSHRRRHVRRPVRRIRRRSVRHSNPMRRHRRHRSNPRRHSRRSSRGMGFLRNPLSIGSFFVLPSVKTALWVGGGALATWYLSNRFVSPFVARFLPAQIAPIAGNLLTAGVLAGVTGMVAGRDAAINVALGGVVYTVLEAATPILSNMLAPAAAPAQVTAPAAGAGYFMGGSGVRPETAAAMAAFTGGPY